ncbi:MAG: hypothetical protein JWM41_3466 [Gemmatimonadetes bacterium]|nr:hypothetical protein [Gemmatimonadota bacterium]
MSHLPSERLAAFVDEPPSMAESLHLATCAECARERAMYQSLAELATAESARIGTPLTSWEKLAPVLAADGVIDRGRGLQFRTGQMRRPWLQAAAALLFVAGGMMAGRYTAGASVLPMNEPATPATAPVANATRPTADSTPRFASVDDARKAQERSQLVYESATAWLARRDTTNVAPETPAGMRTRLAALDRTRQVMGEALRESPYDPVMNGFYMSALGQREATLQQLNTVMPASMRATSY